MRRSDIISRGFSTIVFHHLQNLGYKVVVDIEKGNGRNQKSGSERKESEKIRVGLGKKRKRRRFGVSENWAPHDYL